MTVCGIDEAGRGPLAGPVCAGAVILGEGFPLDCLDDSKRLSEAKRERARALIMQKARAWALGWAWAFEIDKINILRASLLAMKRAYEAIGMAADIAIIDGTFVPEIDCACEARIKADSSVPEVMAASILAKTARDRCMVRYSWIYPEYGYERHKGYPTAEHRRVVLEIGPSPIQRLSFKVR